jgi:hypothetical protein
LAIDYHLGDDRERKLRKGPKVHPKFDIKLLAFFTSEGLVACVRAPVVFISMNEYEHVHYHDHEQDHEHEHEHGHG